MERTSVWTDVGVICRTTFCKGQRERFRWQAGAVDDEDDVADAEGVRIEMAPWASFS